jgi:predicted phage terminase large subunit-like protein
MMTTSPSPPDSTGRLPSPASSISAAELEALEMRLMRASPASLALVTSGGKWRMARHLAWLDRQLLTALDDAAAGLLDGLVVSMPPQHGKSELCSKYLPAWYLANFPDRRVILTSYEADFAAQWGRRVRDILEQWGSAFGVRVSKHSSAVHRWDLDRRDGGMGTAGVGGPITGKGAHLLIVDDPIKNDEVARSAFQRQKQWDWWQSTASTRLRPDGLSIVVQTRWHRDDLAGRLLREAADTGQRWRQLRLPALAEDLDPLRRAPGEPLWPEVYSQEHLARVRDRLTNYYWRAMYQQDPIAEGTTEWPDKFFGPSIWFDEWPEHCEMRIVALDPSKGTDSRFGDYSAFVMGMLANRILYIDADLEVRDISLITERALEINRTFRPDGFAVETNQFQELLARELSRLSLERGIPMTPYHMDNRVPKIVRIRRLTPFLAQDSLRFKADSPGAKLLVRQLRDFPNGDHDDGPDALEMAIRLGSEIAYAAMMPEMDTYEVARA